MGEEAKKEEVAAAAPEAKPEEKKEDKPAEEEKKEETPPAEEKKEEPKPPLPFVLYVDLHCVGCAKKIERSLMKIRGVEGVVIDMAQNQVTIKGIVEPQAVCMRIMKKTKRRAQVLSPLPAVEGEPIPDVVTSQVSRLTTVELNVNMHCEACAQQLKRKILKMRGFEMADMQIVPAVCKDVEAQYVEMMVPLYSYGCEKKIKKAFAHLKGIYSVNVDFQQQKVTVWGICNKHDVLSTMRSKRKGARFWKSEDNCMEMEGSPPPPPFHTPLALTKLGRSLSWKALKKVFIRTHSF